MSLGVNFFAFKGRVWRIGGSDASEVSTPLHCLLAFMGAWAVGIFVGKLMFRCGCSGWGFLEKAFRAYCGWRTALRSTPFRLARLI